MADAGIIEQRVDSLQLLYADFQSIINNKIVESVFWLIDDGWHVFYVSVIAYHAKHLCCKRIASFSC